jgi:hypothetical protein
MVGKKGLAKSGYSKRLIVYAAVGIIAVAALFFVSFRPNSATYTSWNNS